MDAALTSEASRLQPIVYLVIAVLLIIPHRSSRSRNGFTFFLKALFKCENFLVKMSHRMFRAMLEGVFGY
jgi:hypothetical protein